VGEYRRPEYVALRKQVRAGEHGPCVDCGAYDHVTVDHLKPIVLGGRLEDGWAVRCRSCNGRLKGGVRGLTVRIATFPVAGHN
jgi:5-methylcytosine-specific restriction endonuclease McrA